MVLPPPAVVVRPRSPCVDSPASAVSTGLRLSPVSSPDGSDTDEAQSTAHNPRANLTYGEASSRRNSLESVGTAASVGSGDGRAGESSAAGRIIARVQIQQIQDIPPQPPVDDGRSAAAATATAAATVADKTRLLLLAVVRASTWVATIPSKQPLLAVLVGVVALVGMVIIAGVITPAEIVQFATQLPLPTLCLGAIYVLGRVALWVRVWAVARAKRRAHAVSLIALVAKKLLVKEHDGGPYPVDFLYSELRDMVIEGSLASFVRSHARSAVSVSTSASARERDSIGAKSSTKKRVSFGSNAKEVTDHVEDLSAYSFGSA